MTGHESSVLAHLAQRPKDYEHFASTLSPDALQVARCLTGRAEGPADAMQTAEAIRQWARERAEREGQNRKRGR